MLMKKNVSIEFTPESKELIIAKGYNPAMGARPMQRELENEVSRKLAKEVLYGKLEHGGDVKVIVDEGKIAFEIKAKKAKKAPKKDTIDK